MTASLIHVPSWLPSYRKFNPAQPRDPGGEGGGQWTKSPSGIAKAAMHALAEILDDIGIESLDEDNEVYVGIRADGVMDLGIGTNPDSPVMHFHRDDAQMISDEAFALWRLRDDEPNDPDENGAGLIDNTIVDTAGGGQIYLAIKYGVTRPADPDDEDDEDEYGPILTVGIATSDNTEEKPDFHEVDLDEDGF